MTIVVAMSGGVDSSVAAAMLHEAGHLVIGVTLQLSQQAPATGRARGCCASRDVLDARHVAAHLGIAHYVIDAEQRFHDSVIQDFADSYARGETPVPCVRCNQGVKFTDLLDLARALGAEALATGHYVRRIQGEDGPELHQPRDLDRDQSWFLFATTMEQLAFTRFPLGELDSKQAVRERARRLGLATADKRDSQDICFVPDGRHAEAAGRLRPEVLEPGDIVSDSGVVLGRHAGIGRYTVGQARRLGVGLQSGERQVVTRIEPETRRITVGTRNSGSRRLRLREVNWLGRPGTARIACQVRLRARDTMRDAVVHFDGSTAEVELDVAALAAPGQACVLYDGTRILGGGFICR